MSSIYDIAVTTIDGKQTTLNDFAGKAMLVVNVASECGLTPQYEQLEALYKSSQDKGLVVLGFPSNEFKGQEPGTEAEIQEFCSTNYGVTFPMFSKIEVNGGQRHALYQALIGSGQKRQTVADGKLQAKLNGMGLAPENPETDIFWNFEKFLISATGEVVGRFSPDVTVDSELLSAAISQQLS